MSPQTPNHPTAYDPGRAFTEQVLRTGIALVDVFDVLFEDLPPDAFPGEEPAEVLVEMLAGSIRPAVDAAGRETVQAATALLGAILDRTVADLREAAKRARRRRG